MMLSRLLAHLVGSPTVRALRGATTVTADTPEAIAAAVVEMLDALWRQNELRDDEVISAIFTMTPDLTAAFPAFAARSHGWDKVPLLCATEIGVPGSLPRCVRVLVHAERSWAQQPAHVYLRDARRLRPDLA